MALDEEPTGPARFGAGACSVRLAESNESHASEVIIPVGDAAIRSPATAESRGASAVCCMHRGTIGEAEGKAAASSSPLISSKDASRSQQGERAPPNSSSCSFDAFRCCDGDRRRFVDAAAPATAWRLTPLLLLPLWLLLLADRGDRVDDASESDAVWIRRCEPRSMVADE